MYIYIDTKQYITMKRISHWIFVHINLSTKILYMQRKNLRHLYVNIKAKTNVRYRICFLQDGVSRFTHKTTHQFTDTFIRKKLL